MPYMLVGVIPGNLRKASGSRTRPWTRLPRVPMRLRFRFSTFSIGSFQPSLQLIDPGSMLEAPEIKHEFVVEVRLLHLPTQQELRAECCHPRPGKYLEPRCQSHPPNPRRCQLRGQEAKSPIPYCAVLPQNRKTTVEWLLSKPDKAPPPHDCNLLAVQ